MWSKSACCKSQSILTGQNSVCRTVTHVLTRETVSQDQLQRVLMPVNLTYIIVAFNAQTETMRERLVMTGKQCVAENGISGFRIVLESAGTLMRILMLQAFCSYHRSCIFILSTNWLNSKAQWGMLAVSQDVCAQRKQESGGRRSFIRLL